MGGKQSGPDGAGGRIAVKKTGTQLGVERADPATLRRPKMPPAPKDAPAPSRQHRRDLARAGIE